MRIKSLLLGLLAGSLLSPAANAVTTYDLTATSIFPSSFSGFVITFDDGNSDGKYSLGELVTFSGMTLVGVGSYSGMDRVPNTIYSVVSGGGTSCGTAFDECWHMTGGPSGGTLLLDRSYFTYSLDAVGGVAVPAPAALPLLASGLGALGLIGWRRKRRKAAA